jgi:hypothetical protein
MIPSPQPIGVEYFSELNGGYVNTGEKETVSLAPPTGLFYELFALGFDCDAPPGAGSGTHTIKLTCVGSTGSNPECLLAEYTSAYNSNLILHPNGIPHTADSSQFPSNAAEQMQVIKNVFSSDDFKLYLHYFNDSDVNTNKARKWVAGIKIYKMVWKD